MVQKRRRPPTADQQLPPGSPVSPVSREFTDPATGRPPQILIANEVSATEQIVETYVYQYVQLDGSILAKGNSKQRRSRLVRLRQRVRRLYYRLIDERVTNHAETRLAAAQTIQRMYACPEAAEFELKCSLAIRAPYAHAVFHGTPGRQPHAIQTLWK
jgi:hypothetical protein